MKILATSLVMLTSPAFAQDLTVQFSDGAPKDRISLVATGCDLTNAQVTLDLSTSQGALIFDVTAAGAGVEVFQPVEVASGAAVLGPVTDGDTQLQFMVPSLPSGDLLSLSADLDDTIGAHEITVTGSEMAGATVSLVLSVASLSGVFDETGTAQVALPPACTQTAS